MERAVRHPPSDHEVVFILGCILPSHKYRTIRAWFKLYVTGSSRGSCGWWQIIRHERVGDVMKLLFGAKPVTVIIRRRIKYILRVETVPPLPPIWNPVAFGVLVGVEAKNYLQLADVHGSEVD